MIERIEGAGRPAEFAQAIAQATPLQQVQSSQVSSVWIGNAQMNAVIPPPGFDPEVILDLESALGAPEV